VDAIWIENMNTVLDDNKKLCLTSGEIMALSEEMTMMFEPEDLEVASPATVSRCGMIYMEPHSLGYECLFASWLQILPKRLNLIKTKFRIFTDRYMHVTLQMLRRHLSEPLGTTDNTIIQNFLKILDCYFAPFKDVEGRDPKTQEECEDMCECTEALCMFAFIWSMLCTVTFQGRQIFDSFIRSEMASYSETMPIPDGGLIYDYKFCLEDKMWKPWMETISPYNYNPKAEYAELIIPTLDSVRYCYFFHMLVSNKKHVLFVGATGTGKTVNVMNQLGTAFDDKMVPLCLAFSARTSANLTQDTIDSKCEKRRKGVFGPAAGKQFCIFVDDMNMPMKEEYGAQPPIEILRQWFDNGGWFDRKLLEFRKIIDCIMVCACGPPGGGRNEVTARFTRHFNTIAYSDLENSTMELIFETILVNFLKFGTYADPVKDMAAPIVKSVVQIFNNVLDTLRPTPAKCHYSFNLRDISKVFQGMLMMTKQKVSAEIPMARMFCHEATRQFADRFINMEDKNWFQDQLKQKLKANLNLEYDDVMAEKRLIVADFMVPGADPRIYEEVEYDKLQNTCEEYLSEYNHDSKQPMGLVMFLDAIQHVARISRVLRQPKGNMLLLGVGGSGRQSLTRLATFMAEYQIYQVEIAKGYGVADWKENLKECLMHAGIENKPMVFLFNDSQVVFESMLEDLNGVLNSGDVPNLYAMEDLDIIMTTCKPDCVKKRIPPTKLNIYNAYISRVMNNIHMCMCMSPVGDAFRTRLRMFPSFVNCSTIDWFNEWPEDALQHVAVSALTENDMELGDNLQSCVNFVKNCQVSVSKASTDFLAKASRHNYVTPTSYLEVIATYKDLLARKREEVGTMKNRLKVGLDKLISTADQVAGLQETLVEMQPKLAQTQIEVDAMIVQIGIDKEGANETKEIVAKEEEAASKKAADTTAIAEDAQRDLDEALPALEMAVACLNKLKKSDLDEVKSLGKPPAGVKLTMEACCIMFQVKPNRINDPDNVGKKLDDYWSAAKGSVLANANKLLADLMSFDKDHIPESVIKKIDKYIDDPGFTPKEIEKASKACTAICMWVRAMHKYHNVAEAVEPKKKLLAEAQISLDETLSTLKVAQDKLKAVEDRIHGLETNFERANAKKEQLVTDVEECSARLDRAQKLIGGLGGERTRWTESVGTLTHSYDDLMGDVLVSAGFVAYLGPFTPTFRKEISAGWQDLLKELNIPHTHGCDLQMTLADPVAIRSWNIAGLPTDACSTENGIIMAKGRRWPLLMDPQSQANKYIKNMGNDSKFSVNGLDVIKLTDKNFLRTLENDVRFGKWCLLENIRESLDAALEPLLLQQKFIQGGTEMIKIGDSVIPWNNDFKFFMTTKLPNPHYPPEVCVKVSLINFTITPAGLEDQLLGVTIVTELPELEEKKNALVVSNARMKAQLAEIEDKILYMLSHSTGNILDDHELIETLATSKVTSTQIKEKVAEAEITEREIDTTRELYRPIAIRGSILYFAIAGLSSVDPMYQYSLQWYTNLFVNAIRNSEPDEDVNQRLHILQDFFTYYLYVNVCRSLFEKDKLLYSFVMSIKIMQNEGGVDQNEWMFLITGKTSKQVACPNPTGDAGWVDKRCWDEMRFFSSLPSFDGFCEDFTSMVSEWRDLFDHAEPHTQPLPGKWQTQLNPLQKLCVLRAIRADKVCLALQDYVTDDLGVKFVQPPPFDLAACYADSHNMTPLIFVLTSGSDPSKEFFQFGKLNKMDKKTKSLSLGQGQGPIASKMLDEGLQGGMWIYLQNCHLYVSWMGELERRVEEMDPDFTHKDFRLWLTSLPSNGFPVSVLQNGVKMTNEPPKGLRANLRNTYFKLDDEKLKITSKPDSYRKLLFGLALFHAAAQERRKFGPLGWNIPYEFNDTDVDISKSQLERFLDAYDFVPFQVLNFLTSYINYGGRVTDAIDLRTIDVILKQYYQPSTLEDGHKFTEDGVYRTIASDPSEPHKDYMAYIDSLPINAGPEVFGMHLNAALAASQDETFSVLGTIVVLESGGGGGGGADDVEEIVDGVARGLEAACPSLFVLEEIAMAYPIRYEESMNTVLGQECIRYNKLLLEIITTLPMTIKALAGLVVMSTELDLMVKNMYINRVPDNWTAKAYPSLKPLSSWAEELFERVGFVSTWIKEGIPKCFWITGFYFPQAFITGSRQNYARKNQFPIDAVDFNFIVIATPPAEIEAAPEDGVYIRGLYIEGARWNEETLSIDDSRPKQLYTLMPIIHLEPEKDRQPVNEGVYRMPVYKELSRRGILATTGHSSNFIMWLEIPSNREDSQNFFEESDQTTWILAGVACFCSLKF
jgi:dynein heavy chain